MRPASSFGSLSSAVSRCHPVTQRPAGVRPPEWFSKYTIEILDKLQQLLTQVVHRVERPTPDYLPHNHPKHHLDLVQPRTVLRCVNETNAVVRVRQELSAARLRLQHPAHTLLPQVRLDPASLGHQPNQALRAVDVQIVHHEHPVGLRIQGHRLLDMADEISFCARWTDSRGDQLSCRHIEIPDEA